jgi:hypothetical protein
LLTDPSAAPSKSGDPVQFSGGRFLLALLESMLVRFAHLDSDFWGFLRRASLLTSETREASVVRLVGCHSYIATSYTPSPGQLPSDKAAHKVIGASWDFGSVRPHWKRGESPERQSKLILKHLNLTPNRPFSRQIYSAPIFVPSRKLRQQYDDMCNGPCDLNYSANR